LAHVNTPNPDGQKGISSVLHQSLQPSAPTDHQVANIKGAANALIVFRDYRLPWTGGVPAADPVLPWTSVDLNLVEWPDGVFVEKALPPPPRVARAPLARFDRELLFGFGGIGKRGDFGIAKTAPFLPPAPAEIFGANLSYWFDARVGVLHGDDEGTEKVQQWQNQSLGVDTLFSILPGFNVPTYVASGSDGTPEVLFEESTHGLQWEEAIREQFTAYVFMQSGGTKIGGLLWSASNTHGLFVASGGGDTTKAAGHVGGYSQTSLNTVGWHLVRFSVRDIDDDGLSSIAVDDGPEETISLNWDNGLPLGNWLYLSRLTGGQALEGPVKQVFLVDEFLEDDDPRHQQTLDWIKFVYPTLVTY